MKNETIATIEQHFSALKDPRVDRTKRHRLLDILVIAICAVICGADSWEDVEEFGKAKQSWLQTILDLPNGIPLTRYIQSRLCAARPELVSRMLPALGVCGQHSHAGPSRCHRRQNSAPFARQAGREIGD